MKIVYNDRFGGFTLSTQGEEYLKDLMIQNHIDIDFNRPLWWTGIPRHNPYLVQTVEDLGKDAGSKYADLKVFETNSDKYYIEEYDGKEIVYTPDSIPWVHENS